MSDNELRKEVFIKVALSQLANRTAGVLRGNVQLEVSVCPLWLRDVSVISEAILSSASSFSTEPKLDSGIDISNYVVPKTVADTNE